MNLCMHFRYNYDGRYLDPDELRDFLQKEQKVIESSHKVV